MKNKIINIHNEDPKKYGDNYVYVGRGSKFGNPFVIGKDGGRNMVIDKYEEYIRNNKELMNSLSELENKVLGCFCNPLPCHGEVLIKLLNEKNSVDK